MVTGLNTANTVDKKVNFSGQVLMLVAVDLSSHTHKEIRVGRVVPLCMGLDFAVLGYDDTYAICEYQYQGYYDCFHVESLLSVESSR